MKKYFILLLSCFFVGNFALAFQNEPEGFRDLKWGQTLKEINSKNDFRELKGLAEKQKAGQNVKIYYRLTDDPLISGCKMLYINYYFWRSHFYRVEALCTGIDNYLALHKAMEVKFGKADLQENNERFSQHYWNGNDTQVELMFLRDNEEYVSLDLLSIKLQDEMQKDVTIKPTNTSGW